MKILMQRILLGGWAAAFSSGCAYLPKGNIESISQSQPRVYLIRGFQDWYSTGIDTLANELQSQNIQTETFRESQWHELENALVKVSEAPVILVGFSYGADDVISISRTLADHKRCVNLLITIDPVTPSAVPVNVKRCVNFYEPNGFWDIFPWLRGIPLHREKNDSGSLENIDVRQREDLNQPGTSHSTIAANSKVHSAIAKLIAASLAQH